MEPSAALLLGRCVGLLLRLMTSLGALPLELQHRHRPALQFCVNVEVVAVAIKLRGYGPLAANYFLELRAAPEGVGINAITDSGQIELVDTDAESGGGMGFNRSPIPDRRRRRSVLEPR